MRKTTTYFYLLLPAFAGLVFTGCREGYRVENGKVYYESWNEAHGKSKRWIREADAATFHTIELDDKTDFHFGGDRNTMFIDGQPVYGIDPATFTFIGHYIYADKNAPWFFGSYSNLQDCKIPGVPPARIQLLAYPWARAGNILIHGHDTLTLPGISYFRPIDEDFGRTNRHIIYQSTILPLADPQTFRVINSFTGRDATHTYQFGKLIQ